MKALLKKRYCMLGANEDKTSPRPNVTAPANPTRRHPHLVTSVPFTKAETKTKRIKVYLKTNFFSVLGLSEIFLNDVVRWVHADSDGKATNKRFVSRSDF